MTTAITELTEAMTEATKEKKENPPNFLFSPAATKEKREKGPSKLDLVIAWMKENPHQIEEKNQTTLDAYQLATGQTTSLPYIRQAKETVKNAAQ